MQRGLCPAQPMRCVLVVLLLLGWGCLVHCRNIIMSLYTAPTAVRTKCKLELLVRSIAQNIVTPTDVALFVTERSFGAVAAGVAALPHNPHVRWLVRNVTAPVRPRPESGRFPVFLQFLRDSAVAYAHVLLVDSSDVVIQRDPFAASPSTDRVVVVTEHQDPVFGREPFNAWWIWICYGRARLEELQDRRLICSGTFMGPTAAMLEVLALMGDEIAARRCRRRVGSDQGILNHLVYTPEHARLFRVVRQTARPPVWHMALAAVGADPADYSWAGPLLETERGWAPPIVHQYNRHPVVERALQRHYGYPEEACDCCVSRFEQPKVPQVLQWLHGESTPGPRQQPAAG